MLLAQSDSGYPLLNLFWTMLVFFGFVIWFWLLIVIFGDLFRRDMSGWGKAAWTVFLIVLPFLGVLVYLIAQGGEMAERRQADAQAARSRYEQDVRNIAAQPATDQIATAKQLLDSGDITTDEYAVLKARALGQTASSAPPTPAR